MTAYMNWIEFRARDGSLILQRAEDISTVMEAVLPPVKGGPPRTELYLLLANNNRVAVVGEDRHSVLTKLREATGTIIHVIAEEVLPAVAEID